MKYRFIAKIACRIMAIYIFISTFIYLPGAIISINEYLKHYQNAQSLSLLLSSEMTTVLRILACILLWFYADKLSNMIIKGKVNEDVLVTKDYRQIQAIAFSIIGAFIVITTFDLFVSSILLYNRLIAKDIIMHGSREYYMQLSKIISSGIRLFLGLWLLIGSQGLVKALNSVRRFGIETIEEPKQ